MSRGDLEQVNSGVGAVAGVVVEVPLDAETITVEVEGTAEESTGFDRGVADAGATGPGASEVPPDPAPTVTIHGSVAYDLDSIGPAPDVSEDVVTLQAAEDLADGRLGYRFVKRAFDIAFSLLVLVCLSWLFLVIAIAIKADDPKSPVLFRQRRVGNLGRDGRPAEFDMYKFRSMVPDAEERLEELQGLNEKTGPVFKIKEDPRVTRVGRVLRKTSLAPVIIGTPGDGEPTKSLSHPVNSSLDLHKCERRPEPFLVAQTHYTSSRFLSFAVFGGLNAARGRSFCACGATSSKDFRAVL